jgi:hypothetical protein
MLIPLKRIVRDGASDPPRLLDVGVNPDNIRLVTTEEECFGFDGPASRLQFDDGQEMLIAGGARSVILATRGLDEMALRMLGDSP